MTTYSVMGGAKQRRRKWVGWVGWVGNVGIMALPVAEFSRQGYKIGKVFP